MFYLNGDTFLNIRGVMSYTYLTIIAFACMLYFKSYGAPLKIIVFANIIYIFFAIWQLIIGDELINIISPIRTTADRGVTSLAVEPTNLGLVLLVFSWFYLIYTDYKPRKMIKLLIIFNVFSILVLAQSSMAVLYLVLAIALFILYRISFLYLIVLTCILAFGSMATMEYLPDARVSKILTLISNVGVNELIYKDASINVRVASVIFPYEGVIENVFLPGGFTTFEKTAGILKETYSGFFWYGSHTKIMSYIGSFVYHLGFGGVFICLIYFSLIQNGSMKRILESIFLFVLLSSAISVSSPIIALLLCSFIFTKNINSMNNRHVYTQPMTFSPKC
jgi:hypothetical protein